MLPTIPLVLSVNSSFILKPSSYAASHEQATRSHRLRVRPHILRPGPHRHLTVQDRQIGLTQARRQRSELRAALTENPQNVPDPKVLPKLGMSAIEAVEAQLNALRDNDEPWGNHGIQTMYEFGETIGGLDRCYYFGYGKDLYHFDHFMGNFQNAYPELVNLKSYSIQGSKQEEGVHKVLVEVTNQIQTETKSQFVFILAEKESGAKKGALMTRCLIRHEAKP